MHPQVLSEQEGSRRVAELAAQLARLGRAVTPDAVQSLDAISDRAGQEVQAAANELPGHLVRTVAAAMQEAADATLSEKQAKGVVAGFLQNVAADPRNAVEGAEALSTLAKALDHSVRLDAIVGPALDKLESRGLLGQRWLGQLLLLLGGAAAAGSEIKRIVDGGKVYLSVRGVNVSVDRLGRFLATMKTKNPLWAKQAVRLSVKGQIGERKPTVELSLPTTTQTRRGSVSVLPTGSVDLQTGEKTVGLKTTVRFGADEASAVVLPVQVGRLARIYNPSQAIWQEGGLVRGPLSDGQVGTLHFVPLPSDLRMPDAVGSLNLLVGIGFAGWPRSPLTRLAWQRQANLVLASLLCTATYFEADWYWNRLISGLSIVFSERWVDGCHFDGQHRRITVFRGPSAPFYFTHELGHLVDAVLADPVSSAYRSDETGTPLSALVQFAAPLMRPTIEAAAGALTRRILGSSVFDGVREDLLADDTMPLVDLLERVGFTELVAVVLAGDLADVHLWDPPPEGFSIERLELRDRVDLDDWQKDALLTISRLMPNPHQGGSWVTDVVDLELAREAMIARWMSPREVFARLFDQRMRRYFAETTGPWGLSEHPLDMPAENLDLLIESFDEILAEEVDLNWDRVGRSCWKQELREFVVSGLTAAVGIVGSWKP